ncbi:hypothetical protein RUND412_001013 [Rhizina undulata]
MSPPMGYSPEPIAAHEPETSKPHTTEISVQGLRSPLGNNDNGNGLTKREIVVFSDFDGTIFMQDTGHILFDSHGCGPDKRHQLDEEIKTGARSFREVSEEMWSSLKVPFEDGFNVMKRSLEIDPDFKDFHDFCIKHGIPFNVISAGLKPILRRVLDEFLGEKDSKRIDIIANDAKISPDGTTWKPIWRHNTPLGHDKAASIVEYRTVASSENNGTMPLIIFIGDGVSDLAAAQEADVLFARRGLALEEYCIENGIKYYPFDTFADIKAKLIEIMKEDQKATRGQGKPVNYNPRANFWRKTTKKVPRFVKHSTNEDRMHLWPQTFTVKNDENKGPSTNGKTKQPEKQSEQQPEQQSEKQPEQQTEKELVLA